MASTRQPRPTRWAATNDTRWRNALCNRAANFFAACFAAFGSLSLFGAASSALAQDKTVELKISHWVPPSHPLQKALEDWGSSIERASNVTGNDPDAVIKDLKATPAKRNSAY